MKLSTIITSLLLFNFAKCQSNNCYQLEENPFSFFSTKTAYSVVSAKQNYPQQNSTLNVLNQIKTLFSGCKTLQLWLLSRHGTRHPTDVIIDRIYELFKYRSQLSNKSSLCQEDIEAIQKWDFNLTMSDGNKLNSQGFIDLSSLGLRLKNAFEDIFNEPYNSTIYKVTSSPKSRCIYSASSFFTTAFDIVNADIPKMKSDDIRLNISKFKEVHEEDDMKESKNNEVRKFVNSVHMQQVILRVTKTLGFDRNLTYETVKLMYESCRNEKSWHVDSRPAWCAVFSKEDLEVFEYEEDLKYYYSIGYGSKYNERLGCPIVKDIITNFRNKTRTQQGPKGIFLFGHSSNVFSTIVRLGFAKDSSPLLASNFKEMHDRKWRTAKLCPFASNVMAMLYECPTGKQVTFFVNEIPIFVEKLNCTLCPWELIESMFDPIVSSPSCTFDDQTSSASIFSKNIILLFLTYFCAVYYLKN